MNTQIILGIVRHLLTAAGAGGAVVSDNDLMTVISSLVAIGSTAWSIYEKFQAAKTQPVVKE